jgi:serine/threonine kinase 38
MTNLQIKTNLTQTATGTAALVTPQNQNRVKESPQPASNTTTQITKGMKERAEIAKSYIENKYNKRHNDENERKDAWDMLEQKMNNLQLSDKEKVLIKQDILHKEAELNRRARKKVSVKDYDLLPIIGRGAFGEVRICRHRETGQVVAMKKMKKSEME